MEFNPRTLKADEIDCKVAAVRGNGLRIMLWKNNLAVQNVLNDMVGRMNWQTRFLANNECAIDVWDEDKKMWVTKSDFGSVEHDKPEYEKRLASDAMKRAGTQWGIGTELHNFANGIFLWFNEKECNVYRNVEDTDEEGNSIYGEWLEKDNFFKVAEIEYNEDRMVSYIKISNTRTKEVDGRNKKVTEYKEFGIKKEVSESSLKKVEEALPFTKKTEKIKPDMSRPLRERFIGDIKSTALKNRISTCAKAEQITEYLLSEYGVESFKDLTEEEYSQINIEWENIIKKVG